MEDKYNEFLISKEVLKGKFNLLLWFLATIIAFSGWAAMQSTIARRTCDVTKTNVEVNAEFHRETIRAMVARVNNLEDRNLMLAMLSEKVKEIEDKNKDKEKRIQKIERICDI